MAKGRVYCRDKKGREVAWGRGRAWIDFSLKGPDGRSVRVRKPVDCMSKAEAEMELARLVTEKAAELKVKAPTAGFTELDLGPCFDAWAASRLDHPKPISARFAEGRVRAFVEWAGRDLRLADADPDKLAAYRDERVLGQGMKGSTVRTELRYLSGFLRWCMAKPRQWLEDNPIRHVEMPKVRKSRPEGLRDWAAVEAVLAAVAGHPILEPAYRLAFATVCREEIAMARWEHLDFRRGTMLIPDGKNATREADIPLHPIALDWLRERRQDSGFIVPISRNHDRTRRPWGQAIERERQAMNKRRKAAGLLPLPGFHKGRHTIATLMAKDGVPLPITQVMLRHSSPTTTALYYVGVRPMDAEKHIRKLGQD